MLVNSSSKFSIIPQMKNSFIGNPTSRTAFEFINSETKDAALIKKERQQDLNNN